MEKIEERARWLIDEHQIPFSFDELAGKHRGGGLADARHKVMFELKILFGYSYPQIGKLFNRNHTSVIHAVQKVRKARGVEPEVGPY